MSYLDDIAAQIRRHVPNHVLPEGDLDALLRLYAVLALAKGVAVTAEDVHNAWAAWMQQSDPNHNALRPFGELDHATQAEDYPYVDAIRAAARARVSAPSNSG
jgi:hypothetical protein